MLSNGFGHYDPNKVWIQSRKNSPVWFQNGSNRLWSWFVPINKNIHLIWTWGLNFRFKQGLDSNSIKFDCEKFEVGQLGSNGHLWIFWHKVNIIFKFETIYKNLWKNQFTNWIGCKSSAMAVLLNTLPMQLNWQTLQQFLNSYQNLASSTFKCGIFGYKGPIWKCTAYGSICEKICSNWTYGLQIRP